MTFYAFPTQPNKNFNKHAIIDLIRFTPGGISRVELARRMGLTRAAVTAIVGDLSAAGLVRETEGQHAGGRKPIVLEIVPECGRVVGVDMGATHVRIALADFAAHVISEVEAPLDINAGPEICIAEVNRILQELLQKESLTLADFSAMGVGVPGPIVTRAGTVSGPPIMPGWDAYPIRQHMQKMWNLPITLNNDAELGAVGEWAYGAGRGEQNLAYIKVGTGIGAGFLINGQIYQGVTGCAGEIGHITIDENGPTCTCGNRGCLEAFAGGRAIARKAVDSVRLGQRTELAHLVNKPGFSSTDVMAAARRGDLLAQRIVAEAGSHLGTAIAGLVNLFNPGIIIVGGGVAQIGDLLLEPIRVTVKKRSLRVASQAVRITAALLGRRSCSMGAVVQGISLSLHHRLDE